MINSFLRILSLILAAAVLLVTPPASIAGGDWNDAGIKWRPYEAGLAEAKESGKPVCLIFYTDWCPHCTKYSAVFQDAKVVEEAKKFVMVRLNKDEHPAVSAKYAVDGEYIPRTFFLSADGELDKDIHEQRDKYRYFYNTGAPDSLLRGMGEALKKQGGESAS